VVRAAGAHLLVALGYLTSTSSISALLASAVHARDAESRAIKQLGAGDAEQGRHRTRLAEHRLAVI
jgi:hypothetical protein